VVISTIFLKKGMLNNILSLAGWLVAAGWIKITRVQREFGFEAFKNPLDFKFQKF